MAENNSSAPLKTAEGAAPALPYPELWRDSKGIRGYTADLGQGPWFTADQMRAYAAQAVEAQAPTGNWINADDVSRLVRDLDVALHGEDEAAPQASLCDVVGLVKEAAQRLGRPILAAQAAPAAVAVPASWADIEDDRPNSRADLERVMDEWNDTTGALPRDSGWRAEVLGMLHDAYDLGAHQATPALPATKDTSAGDLPEVVQWDGKLSDQLQRAINDLHIECKPAVVRHLDFAIRSEITALHTSLATVKRMYAAARDRLEAIDAAQPDPFASNSQAEVQAEPVGYVDADGFLVVTTGDYIPTGAKLYTAPQAQPADALDAARYRHLRDGVMVDGEINESLYVRVDQASYPNRWALVGQDLDEATDAAMAAAQEGGKAAKEA